jgi:sugar lactone lactonase YvrE
MPSSKFVNSVCLLLSAAFLLSDCGGPHTVPPPVTRTATAYPTLARVVVPTRIPPNTPTPLGDELFLSDAVTGIVERVDLATLETTVIVTGLSFPEDGACNAKGQIYFAETTSDRITRFNRDGSGFTIILDPTLGLTPEGLSFDASGDLFFNTAGYPEKPPPHKHTGVYRIVGGDPANRPELVIPPFTTHGEGTAFLHDGELLAADAINGRIIKSIPPQFGFGGLFASGIVFPVGIAVRSDGDVFVSEGESHRPRILHFDSNGNLLGVFAVPDEIPRHMEFDSSDNLYVGTTAGSVLKFTPTGAVSRVAKARSVSGLAICKAGKGP